MKNISISKIKKIKNFNKYYKKKIKIKGWIKTKRKSKIGISFLDIYDGSSIELLQIIINKKTKIKHKKNIKIKSGCAIIIIGLIKTNKIKKKNEIHALSINIIGYKNNYLKDPISPKYHTLKYLRKISHLRAHTKIITAISKIRNNLFFYLHNFFQKKKFYWIPTPIMTSLNTEGISEIFEVKKYKQNKNFFNKKSFLTVSGQLNLEAYACSLTKVYNLGPVFRAENSNTKKHLAEFWMLEAEIAFSKLDKIINLTKELLYFCTKKIISKNYKEIKFLLNYNKEKISNNIVNILKKKFIEIDYKEIINILNKKQKSFSNQIKWGENLSQEHEKYLTEKYFKLPLIIKNFPKKIKAFYMKTNKDNKTVSSMDIILPYIGEIIGGSERENNLKILDINIKQNNLNKKKYLWYRELRKYISVPHSGFGLGFERFMLYITNIKNIRDITPFPRYPNYIEF